MFAYYHLGLFSHRQLNANVYVLIYYRHTIVGLWVCTAEGYSAGGGGGGGGVLSGVKSTVRGLLLGTYKLIKLRKALVSVRVPY